MLNQNILLMSMTFINLNIYCEKFIFYFIVYNKL